MKFSGKEKNELLALIDERDFSKLEKYILFKIDRAGSLGNSKEYQKNLMRKNRIEQSRKEIKAIEDVILQYPDLDENVKTILWNRKLQCKDMLEKNLNRLEKAVEEGEEGA